MRRSIPSELLPPAPGEAGWPWAQESEPLPDAMPDGQPWPRISIVTPSCNQGELMEEGGQSVLLVGKACSAPVGGHPWC